MIRSAAGTSAPSSSATTYWVVQWSGGGGFGQYAWLLADALAAQRPEVVLATRRTHELDAMPRRHRLLGLWPDAPSTTGRRRSAVVAVQRAWGWTRLVVVVARTGGRGVVHLQAADRLVELPFVWLLRLTGSTVVVTAHNVRPHDPRRLDRLGARLLYRSVHGVVTHTAQMAADIVENAGRPVPTLVVPHPSYAPIVDALGRALTPGEGEPLTVAHLGTIRPYKGFDRVVAAVAGVQQRWPGLRFLVVGKPADVAEVERLVERVGNVEARLEHVPVAELVDAARQADVVVLGHRSSSESGVALLALAAGAAVVAPNVAAIGRLLATEPSWTYADVDDAAETLAAVLADVERDRAAVRARARAVADAVPSWHSMAECTLVFVEGLRR